MILLRTRATALAVALGCAPVAWSAPGAAKDEAAAVDPATKREAAAKFKAAEKAFQRHEYAVAAQIFEEAYAILPHPAALFNAAHAHQKAGQLTRAANLCARYLRDAPEDDARREKANALIAELTPKLGRIEIEARGATDVKLDGDKPEDQVVWVDPGDHLVTGKFGSKAASRKIAVVAGSIARVALELPKQESKQELEEEGDEPEKDAKQDEAKGGKPLSPTVFYVGLGLTAVLGGVTVWSGLDTNRARDQYDGNPTQAGLDEGRAKQSRTNLLLGVTAAAGVGTAVIGVFFTDWKRGSKARPAPDSDVAVELGPGFASVRGQF